VLLLGCWFDEPVALTEATVLALRLPGGQLPALDAKQLTTHSSTRDAHRPAGGGNLPDPDTRPAL